MSPSVIEARIREMTPIIVHARPEPAMPGSISVTALQLPVRAPDIPPVLPLDRRSVTPPPTFALPSTPPVIDVEPAPVVAALSLPPVSLPPLDVPDVVVPLMTAAPEVSNAAQCQPSVVAEQVQAQHGKDGFGDALAAAALTQTAGLVIYNARYTRIAYPGGDVASLQGVCTDVVIRGYRALGIDLQRLVYESRVGAGDTSIDHRRTETLRKFLSIYGETLPVTPFVEDYQPGDIVTYHRPQNRTSTAHIAIVSGVVAPSGRPMIIHNRGLGVQLEDALFVDRITGHYRYTGPAVPQQPIAVASVRRVVPASAQSVAGVTVVRAAAKSPAAAKLALRMSSTRPQSLPR